MIHVDFHPLSISKFRPPLEFSIYCNNDRFLRDRINGKPQIDGSTNIAWNFWSATDLWLPTQGEGIERSMTVRISLKIVVPIIESITVSLLTVLSRVTYPTLSRILNRSITVNTSAVIFSLIYRFDISDRLRIIFKGRFYLSLKKYVILYRLYLFRVV